MSNFHTDYDKAPWRKVSIEDLTTPKPGYLVHGPAWWAITSDGYALFYKSSPQCNTNKSVVERIRPDCTPQYIPLSFEPHRCADFC